MPEFRLTRLVRTMSSEVLLVWRDDKTVGQVDVHYAMDRIYATVVLTDELDEDAELELRAQIDHDVVASYLQDGDRDDFVVTVFRGREARTYCDPPGTPDGIAEGEDVQEDWGPDGSGSYEDVDW